MWWRLAQQRHLARTPVTCGSQDPVPRGRRVAGIMAAVPRSRGLPMRRVGIAAALCLACTLPPTPRAIPTEYAVAMVSGAAADAPPLRGLRAAPSCRAAGGARSGTREGLAAVGLGLGAQAGEARLRAVFEQAGFTH